MSTDVAVRADQDLGQVVIDDAYNQLLLWAQAADAAHQVAQRLVVTSFVPDHFRGKPAEAAAAILTGAELGLKPMAALRAIFVIKGTPGMYAKAMVAVVQSRGHEVWPEEQSDERVVMCGKRKGSANIVKTVWDRARVVRAKLTANPKYQENPQQMMVARGQAEICRQIAADALHGVPYAVEELEDFEPIRAEVVQPKPVTAAEILGAVKPAGEAPPAGVEPPDPDQPAEPQLITGPQQKKLHILLNSTGREHRDVALVWIAGIVKREIATTKELTRIEAGEVIGALEDEIAAQDQSEGGWPDAAQPPADNPVIEDQP